MQLRWKNVLVLLTVLPCCRTIEVSIPQPEYEASRGADVALTCSFVPAQTHIAALVLKWEADPDNIDDPLEPVATYFLNNPVNIAPAYEGRAALEVDIEQRLSTLRLQRVTVKDSRRFQCSVSILNDDEGKTADSTSLVVLVPPSPPVCQIKGSAEYWQDISLTCSSEEGSPKPTYQWKSYSVQNVPRAFPPKTTDQGGVLSLFNISRETSGFFICTSTNRVDAASCNYTLAVMPGGMNEANIGAIIGGVVAGLVVLGIVVFLCCRRKKAKKAEAAGDVTFYDRDAPEAGEQFSDDKSHSETEPQRAYEDKDPARRDPVDEAAGRKMDDDQHSSTSKDRDGDKGSDVNSQRYKDDRYRGSREHLDDQRDRPDDRRDQHGGSRDERRDRHGGSRDRLADDRDHYRGSRDHLNEQRNYQRGSRDHLNEQRDHYRGSRDRLNDQNERYNGYRDHHDDHRDRYNGHRGSRDHLDYRDDEYRD